MATYGRREGSERMMKAAASGAAAVSQASQGLREQYNRSAAMGAEAPVTAFKAASAYRKQEFDEGVQTRREASDKEAADARTSMADKDLDLRKQAQGLRERELGLREMDLERRTEADERRAENEELSVLLRAHEAGATIGEAPGGAPPAAPGGAAPQDPQDPAKKAGAEAQGLQDPQQGGEPTGDPNDPLSQADALLQKLLAGDQERQQEQMGKPLEVTIGGRTVSIPPPKPTGTSLTARANAASGLMNSMAAFRNSRNKAMEAEAAGDQERLLAEQEAMRKAMGKTRDVLNGIAAKMADPKAMADFGEVAAQVQDPEIQAFLQTKGATGKGAAVRFLRNQLMNQNLQYVATGGDFIDADYSHPITADFINLYREAAEDFQSIGALDQQFIQENPIIADLHRNFGTYETWSALDNFTDKNKFLRKQTAALMLTRMMLKSKTDMAAAQGGGGDGRPTTAAGSGEMATRQIMNERRAQNERTRMAGPRPGAGPEEQLRGVNIGGPPGKQDWGAIK